MERATARTIEQNVFMVLQYSLLTGRVRLPGGRRGRAADRRFKLNKGSQLFIGARDNPRQYAASTAACHFSRFSSSRSIRGSGMNQRSATNT